MNNWQALYLSAICLTIFVSIFGIWRLYNKHREALKKVKWKTKATVCYFVVFIFSFLAISVLNFGVLMSARPFAMSAFEVFLLTPFFYCFFLPGGIISWTLVFVLNALFWAHVLFLCIHFTTGIAAAIIRSLSKRYRGRVFVDAAEYCWSFSESYLEETDSYELVVTVQAASGNGSKIIATGKCEEVPFLHLPQIKVTPRLLENIIREAENKGWSPDSEQDYIIEEFQQFGRK